MGKNRIGLDDAVLVDNKIWFCVSDFKCLGSIDIETKEKNFYEILTDGLYSQSRAFGSMKVVGRKIYLIPFHERVIMQFDVDTEEFVSIEIDSNLIKDKKNLFMGAGVYQKYLFVMGADVPAILRLNTDNNEIDYLTSWKQEVDKLIFDSEDAYFRKQCVVINDKLYVPFCNANAVLEVDCISLKTDIHNLGAEKQGYSGISFDGNSFWLSPRKNGSIVKWDYHINQIDIIHISEIDSMGNILTYTGIIWINNKNVLVPAVAKQKCINVESFVELSGEYSFIQEDEKSIIIYERNKGILTLIVKSVAEKTDIEIDDFEVDIGRILQEKESFIVEKKEIGIQKFIRHICR